MSAIPSFSARGSHAQFAVTAEVPNAAIGYPAVILTVEDRSAGVAITIGRDELMPLLRVIRQAVKSVEDAAAGLPTDPVERASRRVQVRSHGAALFRGKILKDYASELGLLRERYVQQFDAWAERQRNPSPPEPEKPPVPEGGWDLSQ